MDMEMRHGFASMRAIVDDKPEAGIGDILTASDICCSKQQMPEKALLVCLCRRNARNRIFGNHKNVHRRLRCDVAKGKALLILKNDVGRNFTGDDFLKNCHAS